MSSDKEKHEMLPAHSQQSEHANGNSQADRWQARPARTRLRKTFTSLLSKIQMGTSATDSDSSDRQIGNVVKSMSKGWGRWS